MNVYVWHNINDCSEAYHTKGGVVVFADTEVEARLIANSTKGCDIALEEKPDEVRTCGNDGGKKVFIMPNAGCC